MSHGCWLLVAGERTEVGRSLDGDHCIEYCTLLGKESNGDGWQFLLRSQNHYSSRVLRDAGRVFRAFFSAALASFPATIFYGLNLVDNQDQP